MKLIVQIPCLNEAETLPVVLAGIPKQIKGVNSVEILVIDDGSTDGTSEVARRHGVKHILRHTGRMGLARSFHDGVVRALELGADIVVNTDGDNQYPQASIPELIQPVVNGSADIVIADRQFRHVEHFSPLKKLLQRFGTKVVNYAAGTNVPDAASGFRAYSRDSLIAINTITSFSYAMETIIQAGNKRLAIACVPVVINPKTRESRLFKNMWHHVSQSGLAIIRSYIMYKPYFIFLSLAAFFFVPGAILFMRYLIFYLQGQHGSHIQSLLLGTVLLMAAMMSLALGVIADLVRINRVLNESALEHIKQLRFARPNKNE